VLNKIFLILVLTALMVSCLNAQRLSLGPQIGYYKARDADHGSFTGGVSLRLKLLPVLGIEASINYRQEQYADGALTVRSCRSCSPD